MRNEQETFRVTYTAGLGALYNINDKWGLETGLYFSDKGFQINDLRITTSAQPDGTGDVGYGVNHYLYLDIPVKLNRKFPINSKNAFIGSIGLGNHIYLDNFSELFLVKNGKVTKMGHNSDQSSNYTPYYASTLISIGFEHQFNEQFSARIEPIYRKGLSTSIDAPIHNLFNSLGLNFGLWLRY